MPTPTKMKMQNDRQENAEQHMKTVEAKEEYHSMKIDNLEGRVSILEEKEDMKSYT